MLPQWRLAGRVVGDDRHVHSRRICPEDEAIDRHVPGRGHVSARRRVPFSVGDALLVEAVGGAVDLSRVVAVGEPHSGLLPGAELPSTLGRVAGLDGC